MEIVPGVYQIDGIKGSNVYLLKDEQLLLIDTGGPGNAGRILKFIKDLGRYPEELTGIIITHSHIDHVGSQTELRALSGAKTMAHRNEVVSTNGNKWTLSPHMIGSNGVILDLLGRFKLFKPKDVDLLLRDGEILPFLDGLRVIHTPGHTPGSICLLLEKREVLFSGDTIINNEDRLSRPLPFGADKDQLQQSLHRLAQLNFNICCSGHGSPMFMVRKKVKELVT
ncbi:MBL fold metallo-hydrolase, partial [Chloroflexota bacterium]